MTFTQEQKRRCIERELRYRERVYPRLVAAGKITQEFADKQIAIFEAIAEDYEEGDLFG